jgi:hypothetical protein
VLLLYTTGMNEEFSQQFLVYKGRGGQNKIETSGGKEYEGRAGNGCDE